MTIVQKYLSYLRYEKNYSLHTEISYSKDLLQFENYLNNNSEKATLISANSDNVRVWISHLIESGINPRSVNRKLSSLKSFYHFLIKTGELNINPLKNITGPKMSSPIPSFVNEKEMDFLLNRDETENDFEIYRNYTILETLYMTGIRRAELIALRDTDIDFSANLIRVTGKRDKQRLIPFSIDTKKMLLAYVECRKKNIQNRSEFSFVKEDGSQLYPMLLYRIIHDSLKRISTLTKASPHILRHSFATNMLNNGAQLNAVKELLGHSSLASTEVYTHTSFEELKKVYKKAHPRA